MAEGVVVDFELINVEHADGNGGPQADGVLPAFAADGVVTPPVGHFGELVHRGGLLDLRPVAVEVDMSVDPCPDDGGMEGLGNVVHGSQGQALLFVLGIVQAGNEDDGRVPENHLFLEHL